VFDDVRQLDFCLPQPAKVMHWEMSTLEGFALLHTWPGYAVRQVGASSCTRLVLPLHNSLAIRFPLSIFSRTV
jgi:hypothetical protein